MLGLIEGSHPIHDMGNVTSYITGTSDNEIEDPNINVFGLPPDAVSLQLLPFFNHSELSAKLCTLCSSLRSIVIESNVYKMYMDHRYSLMTSVGVASLDKLIEKTTKCKPLIAGISMDTTFLQAFMATGHTSLINHQYCELLLKNPFSIP